jgi:Ni,Fe-hydrogenase maturation factor
MLGLGNVLRAGDGFGVRAVEVWRHCRFPARVKGEVLPLRSLAVGEAR